MLVAILIVISVILVAAFIFLLMVHVAKRTDERKTEQDVLQFISDHPEKASMFAMVNGEVTVNAGGSVKRPLASVVKIVIAAEFAEQAAAGEIDVGERISLNELERFYLPNRDGHAHPEWLKSLASNAKEHGVTWLEVANGMIKYSSNANTDFLIDRLGMDRINKRIAVLGLRSHDPVYPLSASMLIYGSLRNNHGLSHRKAAGVMESFNDEEYAGKAKDLMDNMNQAPATVDRLNRHRIPPDAQRIWSAKLPAASAEDYARLLERIQNEREGLSDGASSILKGLLDRDLPPESPYKVIGGKGGSSISILNQAVYCEDREGNRYQTVVFIHDPSGLDLLWLNKKLDLFLHKYIVDASFRELANRTLARDGDSLKFKAYSKA